MFFIKKEGSDRWTSFFLTIHYSNNSHFAFLLHKLLTIKLAKIWKALAHIRVLNDSVGIIIIIVKYINSFTNVLHWIMYNISYCMVRRYYSMKIWYKNFNITTSQNSVTHILYSILTKKNSWALLCNILDVRTSWL